MYPFKSKFHEHLLRSRIGIVKVTVLSVLLSLAGVLCVSAGPMRAQNLKVTLNVTNMTVKEAISRIEKTEGYVFIYNDNLRSELNAPVSLQASNRNIDEVLKQLFAQTNIAYKRSGKQITLYKKINKAEDDSRSSEPTPTKTLPAGKRIVKGKVVDSRGEPIIGATIRVNGKAVATVTDMEGNFLIDMEDGKDLEISYIGYQSQVIKSPGRQVVVNLREYR